MIKYIKVNNILAKIDSLLDKGKCCEEYDYAFRDGNNSALYILKNYIENLEYKTINDEEKAELIANGIMITI